MPTAQQASPMIPVQPPLQNAIIPALSYGGVAATAAGAAALAYAAAGTTAAWLVAGSIALPTAWVLGEFAFLGNGKWVGKLMGGKPADTKLVSMVHEVARRADYPSPAHVFEIPTKEMNAFAAGFGKRGTCVAVTSGLRAALTEQELNAVLAHEMGHILGGDTSKNMHMAAAVAGLGGLYSAGRAILRSAGSSSSTSSKKDKESGGSLAPLGLGLMAAGLLSQFSGHLLRLGVSRRHEFAADAVATELYGADAMVSALNKIHASAARGVKRDVLGARGGAFAHMYIAPDPSAVVMPAVPGSGGFARKDGWLQRAFNLLSTHPTLDERVAAIQKRSPSV